MTVDRTAAIAERIVRQIVRDRRSLALIIVAPIVVMGPTNTIGFRLVGCSVLDSGACSGALPGR